ncbi:MAG: sulfite exporter TauE/SafE family protein [Pyrinomonadaceae bacterium MAG19_C2-C3]|nr:sulfite exporter TauE/SafE family protein [Pyrinomonadaceae bacterium MAG19_C2-C3]
MALLYSSVGHGGASGYLAAFALMNVSAAVMKPSALVLNVLVSTIASIRFYQAGWFSWRIFLPFAVASIPLAYVGGSITLHASLHKQIVGAVLVYAAVRLWLGARATEESFELKNVPLVVALACGTVLGFVSGLVGVGGGIFLSPLLLLARWADVKQASAIAAAFILVNSLAGLAGAWSNVVVLPSGIYLWGATAIAGGLIGAELGSRRFASVTLRRVLAVVLVVAAGKMIFGK